MMYKSDQDNDSLSEPFLKPLSVAHYFFCAALFDDIRQPESYFADDLQAIETRPQKTLCEEPNYYLHTDLIMYHSA